MTRDEAADFRPARYSRRVLLCALGLTPQIVTETLFALMQSTGGREPFVPTEIHVITTTEGAERVRLQLLHPTQGHFYRLFTEYAADYGITASDIRFDDSTVHVMHQGTRPLKDITTIADNTAAADCIIKKVRDITRDPDCAVHVSLAGGRKTMGYLIAYGLSLFGRPQDRLSHVLVTPEYESHPQFFFPTRTSQILYTGQSPGPRDVKPIDTMEAKILLAEMPFVRMRDGLDSALLDGSASYSETVRRAQRALRSPLMELNPEERVATCSGIPVHLGWKEFALLMLLARRVMDGRSPLMPFSAKGSDAAEFAAAFRRTYLDIKREGDQGKLLKSLDKLIARISSAEAVRELQQEYLTHPRTRIAQVMRRQLGLTLAKPYIPENMKDQETGRRAGYALPLATHQIRIVGRSTF